MRADKTEMYCEARESNPIVELDPCLSVLRRLPLSRQVHRLLLRIVDDHQGGGRRYGGGRRERNVEGAPRTWGQVRYTAAIHHAERTAPSTEPYNRHLNTGRLLAPFGIAHDHMFGSLVLPDLHGAEI